MRSFRSRLVLFAVVLGCACGPSGPVTIAVIMPSPSGTYGVDPPAEMSPQPNLSWAVERVNASGGPAGRTLSLDFIAPLADMSADAEKARDTALATDDRYAAVIGPGNSDTLLAVADSFVSAHKPIVSFTSAAADVLRAYGGKDAVWRTRQSDIAQTELLIHLASDAGAQRIALITTLDTAGATFFSWFGFFSKELNFPDSAVTIVPATTTNGTLNCPDLVKSALTPQPDMIFIAAGDPMTEQCLAQAFIMTPTHPRVVFADTGLDPNALAKLAGADGLEGLSVAGDATFATAFAARFANAPLAPHGAAEYDSILLLAYGLAASGGATGQALLDGIKAAVDGRDAGPDSWDQAGITATMAALSSGARPLLHGASGLLQYEPEIYVDPVASTLSHWIIQGGQLSYDRRYFTGDKSFLSSGGVLVAPDQALQSPINDSAWTPTAAQTDTWALVAALSSGWTNYRHQADALAEYQLLRAGGVPDDHIVLVLPDDVAQSSQNPLPGTVRNVPGGPDVRAGAVIDYPTLGASALLNVLSGSASAATPTVLNTTAASDLYIYLVGHGGAEGIAIGAGSAADGLAGTGDVLSPRALRDALCAMSAAGKFRRAFVVIESCYSGVFGDAGYYGIESGCTSGGMTTPLDGVVLISAANSKEVSYAGSYDSAVGAWVSDAFSEQFAGQLGRTPMANLAALYTDVYLRVAGSHSSIYNSANAGHITMVDAGEFFAE